MARKLQLKEKQFSPNKENFSKNRARAALLLPTQELVSLSGAYL